MFKRIIFLFIISFSLYFFYGCNNEKIEELENKVVKLEERNSELEQYIVDLEDEKSYLEDKVSDLESEIFGLENENDELKEMLQYNDIDY